MIKIIKIARLEISILFYSPVAWLVLAIFMVQSGTGFFGMLGGLQELFMMGEKADNLTRLLFPGINGLFDKVLQTLYLYIPLLTMGLISREISSGSIKLLLSSPVKIREFILGKYLAMLYYALMLIAILGIYSFIGTLIIKDADTGLILAGLLSLFLLTATYAAIGLFMSSLTGYQVVAAISTLAVFAALKYVGSIGQSIDFVRDLTYFLSLSGRTENMLNGLITSGDIIYYLLIISLFLGLTILRLKSRPRG
jgi:ABC-2 type transport system permease protein